MVWILRGFGDDILPGKQPLLISINSTPKTSNPVASKNGYFLCFPGTPVIQGNWKQKKRGHDLKNLSGSFKETCKNASFSRWCLERS